MEKEEVEKADEGTEKEGERGGVGRPEPDDSHLNDFHKLLILRMLRPDRLPTGKFFCILFPCIFQRHCLDYLLLLTSFLCYSCVNTFIYVGRYGSISMLVNHAMVDFDKP